MKKLISVLLVFGILNITFSGCTSSRLISIDEASQMKDKKYLILHDAYQTFLLVNYEFTDIKLKGELTKYSKMKGYNIHVYTPVRFNIKVDKNSNINFEMKKSDISKIKYAKIKTVATVLSVVGGLVGIIFAGSLISLLTDGF